MTDIPMLFSGPMVRALLDGRKTQTRRLLKIQGRPGAFQFGQSDTRGFDWHYRRADHVWEDLRHDELKERLPVSVGDRIWVRETWNAFSFSQDGDEAWPTKSIPTAAEMAEIFEQAYRVDVQAVYRESDRARKWFADQTWRPSIHMPRWASRLTLCVTDVRVQRLQDISREDCAEEGCKGWVAHDGQDGETPEEEFRALWDSLNGAPNQWADNPWVYATTFTTHHQNIDHMGEAA